MFEIYYTKNCTAKDIRCRIDIDEGYLSRIIDRFVKLNFVKKRRSSKDSRIKFILLTEKGRSEFLRLDKHSQDAVTEMISNLSDMERNVLIKMMGNIEIILSKV
jgi:DNA-binding MarR family transcriptional regulator